jgi:hypothetical protein
MADRFSILLVIQLDQIVLKWKMLFILCIGYKTNETIITIPAVKQPSDMAQAVNLLTVLSSNLGQDKDYQIFCFPRFLDVHAAIAP